MKQFSDYFRQKSSQNGLELPFIHMQTHLFFFFHWQSSCKHSAAFSFQYRTSGVSAAKVWRTFETVGQCYQWTSNVWSVGCGFYVWVFGCVDIYIYICAGGSEASLPRALCPFIAFQGEDHTLSFVSHFEMSLLLTWELCGGFSSSQSQCVLNVGAVPQCRACWLAFPMFWLEDQTVSQLLRSRALTCIDLWLQESIVWQRRPGNDFAASMAYSAN